MHAFTYNKNLKTSPNWFYVAPIAPQFKEMWITKLPIFQAESTLKYYSVLQKPEYQSTQMLNHSLRLSTVFLNIGLTGKHNKLPAILSQLFGRVFLKFVSCFVVGLVLA